MRVVKGRALSDRDAKGAPPAIMINNRLATRYFPKADPVGQRILIQEIVPGKTELGPEIPWEVVGVVADEKVSGLNDETTAGVYASNDQSPAYGMNLVVRANIDPLSLQKAVTQAIHAVNKNQAISDIRTLEQVKSTSVLGNRLQAGLLLSFATVALLLAAIGIYGVMAYSVAQRTHELGIRSALGASAASLRKLVLVRGLILTGIGLAIGAAGALALTRLLETLLYGVGARDPMTMTFVGAILLAVALVACYVPARRATKVDPIIALRYD
ncbi:MAG: FtsX-like permease family protein [Acidobacteriota bacterium]